MAANVKYLIFPNLTAAQNVSRQVMQDRRGRAKLPEEVTEYYWGVTVHPTSGKAAIEVYTDDPQQMALLTPGQISQLKTLEEAIADEAVDYTEPPLP